MTRNQERLLWLLLVGIAAFNKTDYFLTLDALDKGYKEANPILSPLIGTYEFPLVKLVLVPLLLILVWLMRNRIGDKLIRFVWLPFIGYFLLMVYFRIFIV
ncbi:DUF5658 family protein [Alkalibacter mobilis]|uniref:DUF5658 family protein n=1 Tax=Alkalibacter mobilis TaxID=2787712 RepID=UPI0018A0B290|nr:DUF5658 family protein [Alkalibacter mobilis]MBF7095759.1 hypothetical protein [Alkalibacter mobilis]